MPPYSCRNNDYRSAYKMGVGTTKAMCGMCLESVLQQDRNRRRNNRYFHQSSASTCSEQQRLCGCAKLGKTQQSQHARHSTALLSAAEAIVDSVCATGVPSSFGSVSTATTDYKVTNNYHNSSSSNHRYHRYRSQGQESSSTKNTVDRSAGRAEAIITVTADQKGSKYRDKRYPTKHKYAPSPQIQADPQVGDKFKRRYSLSLAKAASSYSSQQPTHGTTSQDDHVLSTSGTTVKEPNAKTVVDDGRKKESSSLNQSKHNKNKKTKGLVDSHPLFDDNSSAGVSSQDDENNKGSIAATDNTSNTTDANKISTRRINKFLQKLSKEKMINDLQEEPCNHNAGSRSSLEEVPSHLPPLKFDSRPQRSCATSPSSPGESRDNETRNDQQRHPYSHHSTSQCYSGPTPISSRIHHFGKRQEEKDSTLLDRNDSSKPKLKPLDVPIDNDNSESDDDEDDITGPRLATSATFETLDTTTPDTDYVDAHEVAVAVVGNMPPSPSHSTATPCVNNIRTTVDQKQLRDRVPTPRHFPQQPLSPTTMKKERKELYVVKEKLQWTKNKLESTQYELSVLKGIKDLYQRELECKAMECKLAQWRLSHKPLAVEIVAPAPLTAATSVATDESRNSAVTAEETTSHPCPGTPTSVVTADHQDSTDIGLSFSSLSAKTCFETPAEDAPATPDTIESKMAPQGRPFSPQIAMGCTIVVGVVSFVWHNASVLLIFLQWWHQKVGDAFSGHMSIWLLLKFELLNESIRLIHEQIIVYRDAAISALAFGKNLLALFYWMIRGCIWWVSSVDMNDWALRVEERANDALDWVLHLVMMVFRVHRTASLWKSLPAPALDAAAQ